MWSDSITCCVSFLEEVKKLVSLTLNFSVMGCLICVNIMSHTSLWHFHCTLSNDRLFFGTVCLTERCICIAYWIIVAFFNKLWICLFWGGGKVFIVNCLHGVYFQVQNWLFSLIGLRNPKDESAQSRRKYDFNNEVLAWRIKLRKERYCMLNTVPDLSSVLKLSMDKT